MSSRDIDAFIQAARADPTGTLIALDIDGTISEIASMPGNAVVAAQSVLRKLAQRYHVWCISGRDAEAARDLVGVNGIGYIGSHGLEALEQGTPELLVQLPAQSGAIELLVRAVERELPEVAPFVERKRWSVAFHYRALIGERGIEERLLRVLERNIPAGFRLLRGKAVYEVRPDVERDKGSAITWLLERTGARRVLVAGDDVTDIPMFLSLSTLDEPDRVRIAVRSEDTPADLTTNADVIVEGVSELVRLLQQFATA